MDKISCAQRSRNMAAVKGKGNRTTELRLASIFRRHHISGWRRNSNQFGKPDFVFSVKKVAIFADGCFWHGCKKCRTIPTSNRAFWKQKIEKNIQRDILVSRHLKKQGWKVVRVWEHELQKDTFAKLDRISRHLLE